MQSKKIKTLIYRNIFYNNLGFYVNTNYKLIFNINDSIYFNTTIIKQLSFDFKPRNLFYIFVDIYIIAVLNSRFFYYWMQNTSKMYVFIYFL